MSVMCPHYILSLFIVASRCSSAPLIYTISLHITQYCQSTLSLYTVALYCQSILSLKCGEPGTPTPRVTSGVMLMESLDAQGGARQHSQAAVPCLVVLDWALHP